MASPTPTPTPPQSTTDHNNDHQTTNTTTKDEVFQKFEKYGRYLSSIQPVHLLTFASLPLCLGALAGYRRELKVQTSRSPPTPNATTIKTTPSPPVVTTVNTGRLAVAALGIGTILSVTGVSLLSASILHLTNSSSLSELIEKCRRYTPQKRKEWEDRLGLERNSDKLDDVIRTRGMSEEEEWEFVKRKYVPDLVDDGEKEGGEEN